MLRGTDVSVKEVKVSLTPPGPIAYVAGIRNCDLHLNHNIFGIHTENGKASWFVNLSGPQFGIFAPCIRRESYLKDYDAGIISTRDAGAIAAEYRIRAKYSGKKRREARMGWRVVAAMIRVVEEWERKNLVTLIDALRWEDEEGWNECEVEILAMVEGRLERFVEGE